MKKKKIRTFFLTSGVLFGLPLSFYLGTFYSNRQDEQIIIETYLSNLNDCFDLDNTILRTNNQSLLLIEYCVNEFRLEQ